MKTLPPYDDFNNFFGAQALLSTNYDTIYAPTSGVLQVGLPTPGLSIYITSSRDVADYLPSSGPIGALDANYVDPMYTSAGAFGARWLR